MQSTIAEFQRLQQRYSAFTDDELQAVADDSNDLTDTAKMALQSELLRRGIHPRPQPAASSAAAPTEATANFDPVDFDLAVVNRAWDRDEARNLLRILRDAGIPCYLGPGNLEDADAFHSSFDGGVDIKVRELDEQHALSTLSRELSPQLSTDYVARCPKCHSTEIVFQSLDENPASQSSAANNFNWSCDACGYRWKDDGIEEKN